MTADAPVLVNIGLGPWQAPLVAAARGMGYRVVGVDRDPSAPGVALVDLHLALSAHEPEPILRALSGHGLDGSRVRAVITIGSRGSLTCAAALAGALGVRGPALGPDALDTLVDRARFREFLAGLGLPVPRYRTVARPDAAVDLDGPLIVKGVRDTSGSQGLTVVREKARLPAAIAHAQAVQPRPATAEAIVEAYIEGRDIGVLGLFAEGEPRFTAAVLRQVDPMPHCLPRHYRAPAGLSEAEGAALEAGFLAIARGAGMGSGPFYVEFRLADADGACYALEAEPTLPAYAARLVADAHGLDLYGLFIESVVEGRRTEIAGGPPRGAACHFVYGDRPGTIRRVRVGDDGADDCSIRVLRRPGQAVDNASAASVCAVVFAAAADAPAASAAARAGARRVSVELEPLAEARSSATA